jgi:hypothetical protein
MTLRTDPLSAQGTGYLAGITGDSPAPLLLEAVAPSDIVSSMFDAFVSPAHLGDWFTLSADVPWSAYEGPLAASNGLWAGFQLLELDLQAAVVAYAMPYGEAFPAAALVLDVPLGVSSLSLSYDIPPTLWAEPSAAANSMAPLADNSLWQHAAQQQQTTSPAMVVNQMLDGQEVSNVVAEMSRDGAHQSMTLATVEDVSYTPALMQLIAGDW